MISKLHIFLLLIFITYSHNVDVKLDDDVYVLTDGNFKEFVRENTSVFVKYYAPWCGHCKKLAPEYHEIAKYFNDNKNVKIAKVDCTENQELCKSNGVSGYPTLFYYEGNYRGVKFSGERSKNGIISYIKSKLEPSKELPTVHDVVQLINSLSDEQKAFVFVGTKGFENYIAQIKTEPSISFYHIKESNSFKEKDGSLISFGSNGYKNVLEPELLLSNFPFFIKSELSLPVTYMNNIIYQKLLREKSPALILIFDEANKERIIKLGRDFSKGINKEIMVILVPHNSSIQEDIYVINIYRLVVTKAPFAAIIEADNRRKKYYYKEAELNLEGLFTLFTNWKEKKIEFDYLSEDIPTKQGDVYTLVAHTFDKIVNDKEKDVVVFFSSPHCGHCKKVEPIYEELARHYKDDPNIIISKINCKENELEFIIGSFPTFYIYPGQSSNSIFYKENERTVKALSNFVEENRFYKNEKKKINKKDDL